MRFLADENVARPTILLLRAAGHEIESMSELAPGTPDEEVLQRARLGGHILITFDRDFGELVYRRGAPVPAGIIYLRLRGVMPGPIASILINLIESPDIELSGRFTVVDPEKVRQRALVRPG
jgi:predicted nuclease of predicted toxin-antitoxin system